MFWFGAALVIAIFFFFRFIFKRDIVGAMIAFVLSGIVAAIFAIIMGAIIGSFSFANPDNWETTEVTLVRFEDTPHYVTITLGESGYVYYTFHYKEEGGAVTTRSILATRAVIHEQDARDEAVAMLWEDKTSLEMFYFYFSKSDFVEFLVPRGTVFNNIPIGIKP